MKLTNDILLQIQAGIISIGRMPNISLNEKATFGLIKNKRKIESALEPYNEARAKLWESHGGIVRVTNPVTGDGIWELPETFSPDEKAEKKKLIDASLKSLAEEKSDIDLHIVKFKCFKSEENKIPVAIVELLEHMIEFED